MRGPLNCRSLGYAQDDKGEGTAIPQRRDQTDGPHVPEGRREDSALVQDRQFRNSNEPTFSACATLLHLSSRAQSRDLQFSGPLVVS
jgi:hypothetical protein